MAVWQALFSAQPAVRYQTRAAKAAPALAQVFKHRQVDAAVTQLPTLAARRVVVSAITNFVDMVAVAAPTQRTRTAPTKTRIHLVCGDLDNVLRLYKTRNSQQAAEQPSSARMGNQPTIPVRLSRAAQCASSAVPDRDHRVCSGL